MDASIAAAAIAAIISAVATLLVARLKSQVQEIHVMVNSNLDSAKAERALAIKQLADLNSEHARIVADAVSQASKASLQAILDQYDLKKKL